MKRGMELDDASEATEGTPFDDAPGDTVPGVDDGEGSKEAVQVVAIGSSAGGYEAVRELFDAIRPDTGMAFILVPHLDPAHESHLSDLLGRHTKMRVQEASDGMRVEPDQVYVIAPDTVMEIEDGALRLTKRIKGEERMVRLIDRFFRSLADAYGEMGACVVLSGALTDGTQGVRDIKAAGGFTFAQEPETASFPEMPRSAIKTGVVDRVGSPAEIARELGRLNRNLREKPKASVEEPRVDDKTEAALIRVLDALRKVTGADFRDYKRTTLLRRVHRRLIATKMVDLVDYAKLVESSAEEAERLQREILILVTKFFRDPEISKSVEDEVIPKLLSERAYDDPVRVWVAGCATGEEAYSLAIQFTEYVEKHNLAVRFQVFATDLSAQAIRTAREGFYPEGITADVSEERLARFFEPVSNGYRIRKHIRGMCVFAEHNLVTDPPFSNIDLASCRNVLVYMRPGLQRRALEALHYSLRSGGFLVLGTAETLGRNRDLFNLVDGSRNILSKRDVSPARAAQYMTHRMPMTVGGARRETMGAFDPQSIEREADRILLERFSPPGVVVDDSMRLIHFRGPSPRFFKHRAGPANLDVMQLVPDALSVRIRETIRKVDQTGTAAVSNNVSFDHEGRSVSLTLDVLPLRRKEGREKYYLITFMEDKGGRRRERPPVGAGGFLGLFSGGRKREYERHIGKLQKELKEARDHLRHVSADHEAAMEELRSANEEAISTNEELQSTNEELETTKEELQSTNEELTTLNEELNIRNEDLQNTNNDLVNLLRSVGLPIIMLGPDLKIRRFTQRSKELFNLIASDVDRPLLDIQASFDVTGLKSDLLKVLETYQRGERTIETQEGVSWELKIHPYRTSENVVDGVVLVATQRGAA